MIPSAYNILAEDSIQLRVYRLEFLQGLAGILDSSRQIRLKSHVVVENSRCCSHLT